MAREIYCPDFAKVAVEQLDLAIIMTDQLNQLGTDRTITSVGTPVIRKGPDSSLTISGETKNTSTYTSQKEGTTHVAGEVILYSVSAGTAGERYEVLFPCTLNDGQVVAVIQPFTVI